MIIWGLYYPSYIEDDDNPTKDSLKTGQYNGMRVWNTAQVGVIRVLDVVNGRVPCWLGLWHMKFLGGFNHDLTATSAES